MSNVLRFELARQKALDHIEELMKTKEFAKTKEYYCIKATDPCEDHWVEFTGFASDGSMIEFGCLTCGYREQWVAKD